MATSSAKPVTPFSVLDTIPPRTNITKVHSAATYSKLLLHPKDCEFEAANSVISHSNANKPAARRILNVFFDSTLEDYYGNDGEKLTKARAAVVIVATLESNSGDAHVWHRDANGAPVQNGHIHSRYSMTMVGPPSDVLFANSEVDATVPSFSHSPLAFILDGQRTRPLSTGQIYRFTTGQTDSPVHSTLVFTTDRIFVSVVCYYGS